MLSIMGLVPSTAAWVTLPDGHEALLAALAHPDRVDKLDCCASYGITASPCLSQVTFIGSIQSMANWLAPDLASIRASLSSAAPPCPSSHPASQLARSIASAAGASLEHPSRHRPVVVQAPRNQSSRVSVPKSKRGGKDGRSSDPSAPR
jgi:hypothetical protein